MFYDGEHICKSPDLSDAVTFNLTGPGEMKTFNGVLKAAIDPNGDNESHTTFVIKKDQPIAISQQVTWC